MLTKSLVQCRNVSLTLPAMHTTQREFYNRPERFLVGCMGSKFGKALSIDSKVFTTLGWKTVQELSPGDYVFSEDGTPTKVVDTTEVMYNHDCYKIEFSTGNSVVADAGHLWKVKSRLCRKAEGRIKSGKEPYRKRTKHTSIVLTTEELFNSFSVKVGLNIVPNYSVDLCKSLELPEKKYDLDPYLLGLWLGDGSTNTNGYSSSDIELIDAFRKNGFIVEQVGKRKHNWKILGFHPYLRKFGVYGNRSKFVPEEYLYGSASQRLALLQGLMDTDGCVDVRGSHCCFDNTNKNLADAVYWLVTSLGIKAFRYEKDAKLNGVSKKLCYRVRFTTDIPVFRLPRKLARLRSVADKAKRVMITNITPVSSVPVKCISVEHPSKMFLVGEFLVPTHNSHGGAIKMVQEAWNHEGWVLWWVAPVYQQCKIGLNEIIKLLPSARFNYYKSDMIVELIKANGQPYSRIEFKSAQEPDKLRGFKVNLALMDEADRISEESFLSVYTTLAPVKGRAIIVSTPKTRSGPFYREWIKGIKDSPQYDLNYYSGTYPTSCNPYIDPEILEQARKNLPEDVFRTEYLAEWPSGDGGTVFRDFTGCILKNATFEEPNQGHAYVMGVDLAKQKDFTVLTVVDKVTRSVVFWERFNELDWNVQKAKIVYTAMKYNKAMIVVDATGIGDVVLDNLRDTAQFPVVGYKISTNEMKKSLIELLRMAIINKTIFFPVIRQLMTELQMFEYKITMSGNVQYAAPTGFHDDCVISLALAIYGLDQEPFVYRYRNLRGI